MPRILVIASYDLVTPPGAHAAFKTALQIEKWNFSNGSAAMPNTTCWALYKPGDIGSVEQTARKEFRSIEQQIRSQTPGFKVERLTILACPEDKVVIKSE
jgi:hypothetical protein